ncbi:AIPR family protein [Micromonospora musae]|uniref:AIPR family protein n=1 Tax=Micromonospora musae TaxID=1894970 RepID=UPI003411B308
MTGTKIQAPTCSAIRRFPRSTLTVLDLQAQIAGIEPDLLPLRVNGITVLADEIYTVRRHGTEARLHRARVVNGVQTIMALARLDQEDSSKLADVEVAIRLLVRPT